MDIKYAYYLSSVGYKIVGKTDNDIVLAGGGTKTVNSFWHDGNFAPSDFVPKTRTITINGVAKDLSANATFTTPDTITRIKGGSGGTLSSGDITLLAGANIGIAQTGSNITFSATDTTYTAGSGLTLTGTTFSLPITASGSGNVVTGVTQTANGLTVTLGSVPTVGDLSNYIPNSQKGVAGGVATLDGTGLIPTSQLPSYVDDIVEAASLTALNALPANEKVAGKIYVALDTNKTYRWSDSTFVYITSGAVDSVAGKTGVVTLDKADVGLANVDNTADANKNVLSATKLTTARTITLSGVTATPQSFDGSANISIPITSVPAGIVTGVLNNSTTGSSATLTTPRSIGATGDATWTVTFDGSANVSSVLTLANTGVTAGTYDKVTVDAKGRVTAGVNEVKSYSTTISGTATVTHNLGTNDVIVTMRDTVTKYKVDGRIKITDSTKIDVEFDSTPPNTIAITVTKANI